MGGLTLDAGGVLQTHGLTTILGLVLDLLTEEGLGVSNSGGSKVVVDEEVGRLVGTFVEVSI